MMKETIRQIEEIKRNNPYPEDIFIEPNWKKVTSTLKKAGLSPDAIFGSWGRQVWNNCCEDIIKKLSEDTE